MSNPYSISDISQLARQQMKLYQSSTASIRNYFETSYKLTSNYNQIIKGSMIVSKRVNEMHRAVSKSVISAYIKEVSGPAASVAKLTDAMKPLLKNGNLATMSAANKILNEISINPVSSYNSLLKSLEAPSTPSFDLPNYGSRNKSHDIKNNNQDSGSETEGDNSFNVAKNVIKEYTYSIKKYYAERYDPETAINFFVNLMQFIVFLSFVVGVSSDTRAGIEVSSALCGCIKWALEYDQKHRNN